jgi:hypothetical protein
MVSAGPDQYLLVGRGGTLENRGSAVSAFLRPGSIYVLVPSTKQEAVFEFTQETKDGIPLRFKGIIIYRITDPVAAARQFDFSHGAGLAQVTNLLTHVCLGELRHTVSGMTMAECIEQRKTTLSGVADAALQATIRGGDGGADEWGITVEVAQLAQVFIVDPQLRQQLEAEVRNEIRLKSDQSDIRTREETRLAEMASSGRLDERKLAGDREEMRRQEELELAQLARRRRMDAEALADERGALAVELERFHAQVKADEDRAVTETPVRLLRIAKEAEILRDELEMRRLRNEVRALEVEHELQLDRARQELRREILPLEQAPRIVEAASRVLHGTSLSLYGDDAGLVGQLAPVLEVLGGAVRQAVQAVPGPEPARGSAPESARESAPES